MSPLCFGTDAEYDPSGNANSSFYIAADIWNFYFKFLYNFLIFLHV